MSGYFEQRPTFVGEVVSATVTIDGEGTISGQQFAGKLYDPNGTEVPDAVEVDIADAEERTLTVTISDLFVAGDHRLVVTRTDDDLGLVVVRGVIEVTDPMKM